MLIKSGTVVDGTGAEPFAADVRIGDGLITEVGPNLTAGQIPHRNRQSQPDQAPDQEPVIRLERREGDPEKKAQLQDEA